MKKNLLNFIACPQWSADEIRDELQWYVVEHLGTEDGVLILDEFGFVKRGTRSAGVARMLSGTTGRIENCQLGVFLGYATPRGHTLIDRELYLPNTWTDDRVRCRKAHIPDEVEFATKPQLARCMLQRTIEAGVPAKWVIADEIYGSNLSFRRCCEQLGLGYVVAIPSSTHFSLQGHRANVSNHLIRVPPQAWQQLPYGSGTKRECLHDWSLVTWPVPENCGFRRGWLIRRSITQLTNIVHYFVHVPAETSLEEIVRIADHRCMIEECFERARRLTGMDAYKVRSWDGWYRHVTLSMLAYATLVVINASIEVRSSL